MSGDCGDDTPVRESGGNFLFGRDVSRDVDDAPGKSVSTEARVVTDQRGAEDD